MITKYDSVEKIDRQGLDNENIQHPNWSGTGHIKYTIFSGWLIAMYHTTGDKEYIRTLVFESLLPLSQAKLLGRNDDWNYLWHDDKPTSYSRFILENLETYLAAEMIL